MGHGWPLLQFQQRLSRGLFFFLERPLELAVVWNQPGKKVLQNRLLKHQDLHLSRQWRWVWTQWRLFGLINSCFFSFLEANSIGDWCYHSQTYFLLELRGWHTATLGQNAHFYKQSFSGKKISPFVDIFSIVPLLPQAADRKKTNCLQILFGLVIYTDKNIPKKSVDFC